MSTGLTPPPERDFPAGRLQQRKEQLVSQIYAADAAPTRHHPRRVLALAAALAVAGILAAAAYAGYALTRATPVATIGCYESDSLDANTAVLTSGAGSPVAACAATFASAFPDAQKPASFTACVLGSGSVGVFPSDAAGDTCKSLGLSPLPDHRTK
jgi:hypothetical protein